MFPRGSAAHISLHPACLLDLCKLASGGIGSIRLAKIWDHTIYQKASFRCLFGHASALTTKSPVRQCGRLAAGRYVAHWITGLLSGVDWPDWRDSRSPKLAENNEESQKAAELAAGCRSSSSCLPSAAPTLPTTKMSCATVSPLRVYASVHRTEVGDE